jgi:hypothetical protein
MPTVEIRRNSDGVVRTYEDKWPWDGDYIWADGNYSCDCNRALFFARAVEDDDETDANCGNGAYSVRITEGGKLLYQDDAWDAAPTA